jgi:pimeloyl-ACP methyl ester carboxylesterase
MEPFTPKLASKKLAAGHWIMLEKPDEVNEVLDRFFSVGLELHTV